MSAVFFLVLFHSIRFEPDDMITSATLTGSPLCDVFVDKYHSTSFRPLFILTSFFTIGYQTTDALHYNLTVFVYFIAIYFLFVFSSVRLLKEIFSIHATSLKEEALLWSFANLFFLVLYFFTTEKIEIFGWYCCSTIYLLPVSISFYAASVLLRNEKRRSDFVKLFLCAQFIAGGAEHVPASIISAISVILIMLLIEKKTDRVIFLKTVFFTVALLIFFLLFVTNPGVWNHYSDTQHDAQKVGNKLDLFDAFIMFCKPAKLIGILLAVITVVLFSSHFKSFPKEKIKLRYFIAALGVIKIIALATGAFAYNSFTLGRIWFVADVAFFVFVCAAVFKYVPTIKSLRAGLVSAAVLSVVILIFGARHIPPLVKFSSEHDKIIHELRQQRSSPVILKSFPYPDLTNQVRLSPDTNNAENQLFCRFYGISAKVALKE
ncbi:MAG: DUF6056 family protein [Bacteroidia bacterium]